MTIPLYAERFKIVHRILDKVPGTMTSDDKAILRSWTRHMKKEAKVNQ